MLNSPGPIPELAEDGSQTTTSPRQMPSASSSVKSCDDSTSGIKLYFFGVPGRIKIGVSRNVQQRLRNVGLHLDPKPTLLGFIAGSYDLEHLIHGRLADHRCEGEWFLDCREVRSVMDRVLSGEKFGARKRRGPKPRPFAPQRERTPEEWLAMFNTLVAMVFPGDPVGDLANRLELDHGDMRDYLKGAKPVPMVVRFAFGAVLADWITPPFKRS